MGRPTTLERVKQAEAMDVIDPPETTGSDVAETKAKTTTDTAQRLSLDRLWLIQLGILAIVAVFTRMLRLSYPTDQGTPVFDEKHYVPQAWQILRSWDQWFIGGIEDNPGFGLVVHPPLAKHIEAVGMALFGYSPFGWRFMSALCASIVVVLIAAIARRVSGSQSVGIIAGIFALCDGILFVTGRSAMLDHMQTLFVVAAAYLLVCDASQMNKRFSRVWDEGRMSDHPWGPRMGFRWYRFAAGITLGCALAIKWSGLYYMAFAGVAVVAVDYFRRHRYGVQRPLLGTLVFDVVPHFLSIVLLPIAVYFFSFRAWFASETSVFRHAAASGEYEDINNWPLSFLPDWLENFIYYHYSVLQFHTELTNSNGHYHSWESKPWSWLVSSRSLMYYNPELEGKHQTVLLVGTPAIWWVSVPVLLWGLWCLAIRREYMWFLPLVGFAAGFLPWLLNLDRQMYLFYAVNLAPFLVILLALAVGQLLRLRTYWSYGIAIVYVAFVVWNFLFFLPIYTGMPLTDLQWSQRIWLPSWI